MLFFMSFRRICFTPSVLPALALFGLCSVPQTGNCQDPGSSKVVVSDRAKEIHARGYVFDGHNDLPWEIRQFSRHFDDCDISQPQPKLQTDIGRLHQGNVGAQFWSVYVPASTMKTGVAYQMTVEQIDLVHTMIKRYPETFQLCLTSSDVEEARKNGKIASLIGMEGGHSIEDSLQNLRRLYDMGARYMTLTHSATLSWADSATDQSKHDGLSPFGEEVVREMNRLGMLVDISHVSEATMHKALDITKAPVIFSHSSARAIADHPRNIPDSVLKRLPENGGVAMVNFYPVFVVPENAKIATEVTRMRAELPGQYPDDPSKVEREIRQYQVKNPYVRGDAHIVMDHIDHMIKTAGVDHVGIGSDYDGIPSTPRGMEDVSTYPVITELMLQRGYSEEDIHKVFHKNVLRVLKGAEEAAGKE